MSFIGNIAAAQSAKAIGKYNASVAYQEAQYERKKAAVREQVYKTVERPRLLDQQDQQYANFFVSSLRSGAEMRDGTTPMFVALKNKQLQSFDLAISDYNSKVTAFQKLDPSLSDNFKKVKIEEINELEQDLQKSQQNGNSLISLKKDQLMNPLYQILGEAITEIAKAEGFTQVLTSSGNEFAYIDGAFDITEKVMAKLGLKMPPPVKN